MAAKKTTKKPQSWFVQKLKKMGACASAVRYAKTHRTFPAAWRECNDAGWRFWLLVMLGFSATHPEHCCAPDAMKKVNHAFPVERVAKALRSYK